MKPYPKYKDSGIEWIGKVPEHWKLPKMGTHTDLINGYPFSSEHFNHTKGMPLVRIRDITTGFTETYFKGDYPSESVIENEDILIGMDGDFLVRWWQGGRSLLNQRCCCLRPLETVNKRFLFYLLQSPLNVINDLTYFTTVKHLSSFQVKDIRFPYPPTVNEQQAIADYLDEKTALIDELISKKQRQIELLKEQRQNVINQAVTKGLDPDVEMKDSGIEWLGKIPKHWEVKKLKYLVSLINEKTDNTSSFDFRIALENIESFTGRAIGNCDALENVGNVFQKNDVLFNKLRPYLCKVIVAPKDGVGTGELLVLRPKHLVISTFIFFRLLSDCFIDVINGSTYGAKMPRANWYFIGNLGIPFPSIEKQTQIVEYLQEQFEEIDNAVSKAEKQIQLLQEYRTALISEAVTGKIDVRDCLNTQ